MVTLNNLFDNENVHVIDQKGNIRIIEYIQDKSVSASNAMMEYYASKMNSRRRQAIIALKNEGFAISAGAMQWTAGSVTAGTDVKGVGDFFGKALKGAVTKESAIKPVYRGTGYLMLEPTYKYLIVEEIGAWGRGMVLDDGLFLGCQEQVTRNVIARKSASSALLGNEGLFNLALAGSGYAVLESPVPREELIEVILDNDEIRIDGSFAVAWSADLNFTVEKSTKTLIGSAASGEGLVNVYRGTGRVLMAPVETARYAVKPSNAKK